MADLRRKQADQANRGMPVGFEESPESDVLFAGKGSGPHAYHRAYLPAAALGFDWCPLVDEPPRLRPYFGMVGGQTVPDFFRYPIVVLQEPAHPNWQELIGELRDRGTRVLVDFDSYVLGEDMVKMIGVPEIARLERLMRSTDGVICPTPYVRDLYAQKGIAAHVCEDGIDAGLYAVTRPPSETVTIGWVGLQFDTRAIQEWLQEVIRVMRLRPQVGFVSIGEQAAEVINRSGMVETERCLALPFITVENYPAALTQIDIVIAPCGETPWFLSKGQLRWYEAGGTGAVLVGDPAVYSELEDGVTGRHARNRSELGRVLLELIDDAESRQAIGARAREVVLERHSFERKAPMWLEAFEAGAP